MFDDNLIPMKL